MKHPLVTLSALSVLTLAGCAAAGGHPNSLRDYPTEPQVSWSHAFDSDSDELLNVFDWPSRGAVIAVSNYDWLSDQEGEILLELIDVESGDVLESSPLSRLFILENDAEDYSLGGLEAENGEFLLVANFGGDAHVGRIGLEGFDIVDDLSADDGFFGLIEPSFFGQPVISSFDEEAESISLLDGDFTEVAVIESFGADREVAGQYAEGLVVVDLASERDVVFSFISVASPENGRADVTLSRNDEDAYPNWIGQVGSDYLFAENNDDRWELILVSPESDIIDSISVDAPSSSFGTDFLTISGDKIYVIQEFRENFSATVYDSSLTELSDIPLDRVEDVSWGYAFPEAESLNLLLLRADDSFALFDTRTNEVSRFRAFSERFFNLAGLGFSAEAFFIVDRAELISYDFELGSNWSFKLLDDESILRVGQNLFLNREGDKELSLLMSE